MTTKELKALFKKHDDEFLEFKRVEPQRSSPDIHAFLLLNELCPNGANRDMVSGARHDEIFLRVEPEELAAVVTEAQVIELIRCGVRLDDGNLCMIV